MDLDGKKKIRSGGGFQDYFFQRLQHFILWITKERIQESVAYLWDWFGAVWLLGHGGGIRCLSAIIVSYALNRIIKKNVLNMVNQSISSQWVKS